MSQERSAAAARGVAPFGELGLSELCARIAVELELARQAAMRVEQSLCNAAAAWGVDDERVRDLQQLDALIQQLAALRDFLGVFAQTRDERRLHAHAALERIVLEDVKERLARGTLSGERGREVEIF